MSIVPIIAGNVAIMAAVNHKKKLNREEEDMTRYEGNDLDRWEFKIVRSASGKFKHQNQVQQVCQEESKFGWELMEKFDNSRIRFKRLIDKRSGDQYHEGDPYRTSYGMSEGAMVALILGVVFGALGIGLLTVYIISLNI